MTREEFEIFKAELMERFYWCTTMAEMRYLTKEKGYKFLFRCTHFKADKYFGVFDKTDRLLFVNQGKRMLYFREGIGFYMENQNQKAKKKKAWKPKPRYMGGLPIGTGKESLALSVAMKMDKAILHTVHS